jgi:hypothetical protein
MPTCIFDAHKCLRYGRSDPNYSFFSGTHDILNASNVHMEKGSFCATLKEFGLKLLPNVLVFEKFTERNNFAK